MEFKRKYTVWYDHCEFPTQRGMHWSEADIEEQYFNQSWHDPQRLGTLEDRDAAEALVYMSTREEQGQLGWRLKCDITIVAKEEYIIDDDGTEEYNQELHHDFWAMPINVPVADIDDREW